MAALKNVIILYTVAEVSARLGPMECVRLPTLLLADKWGLAGKLVVGSSGRLFEMWHMIGSSSWMVASCTKARVERRVPRLGPSDAQFSRSRSSRKDEELWFVCGFFPLSTIPEGGFYTSGLGSMNWVIVLDNRLVVSWLAMSWSRLSWQRTDQDEVGGELAETRSVGNELEWVLFRQEISIMVVVVVPCSFTRKILFCDDEVLSYRVAIESPCFPSEPSGTPLLYRIELNLVHRYGILNKVRRIKAYCSVRTVCTISIGEWDRRYIGMPHYTVFSLSSGKAPYRPVCTGPVVDRYVDRPLSGGTAKRRSIEGKIDRRRSISAVGGRLRRNREGKKKKKRKRKKKK
ncbi:hypothetical protein BHM03_00017802 [Ensete ventricosum]|nr:hypothetical protein BHM03_00017802 [Ensete ventricosum]